MPELNHEAHASEARIALTTVLDIEAARQIGKTLVEEKLAACATLLPAAESIYFWQNKVETASEVLLLLKTESHQIAALQKRLHQLHNYETPEFLVLPVTSGSEKYLNWIHASLNRP